MFRHYNITIKGRVQGVSYRFSAHARALKLGLNGFVRNQANGNVYLEIEGSEDSIHKMIDWCQIGPPLADVEEVEATEATMRYFSSFEIKR